jgi:tetratricopeptide (TPR) repeat protein
MENHTATKTTDMFEKLRKMLRQEQHNMTGMETVSIVEEDPSPAEEVRNLLENGMFDEALHFAEDKSKWKSERCRLSRLAIVNRKLGNFEEASQACEELIPLCHTQEEKSVPYSYLSAITLGEGNFEESVSYANKAISIYPHWAGPWLNLLCAFSLNKDNQGCKDSFNRMITSYPNCENNAYLVERLQNDPQLHYFRELLDQ